MEDRREGEQKGLRDDETDRLHKFMSARESVQASE